MSDHSHPQTGSKAVPTLLAMLKAHGLFATTAAEILRTRMRLYPNGTGRMDRAVIGESVFRYMTKYTR